MSDEVRVQVILLIPSQGGKYETKLIDDVYVNVRVSVRRLLPQLLEVVKEEFDIDWSPDDVDVLVQWPDGSSLANGSIQEGCKLLITSKYPNKLVRRGNKN